PAHGIFDAAPDRDFRGVLAVLCLPASEGGDASPSLCRHDTGSPLFDPGDRRAAALVSALGTRCRLWSRLDRSLLHRKKSSGNVSVSPLVLLGRLQDVRSDVAGKDVGGGEASRSVARNLAPIKKPRFAGLLFDRF